MRTCMLTSVSNPFLPWGRAGGLSISLSTCTCRAADGVRDRLLQDVRLVCEVIGCQVLQGSALHGLVHHHVRICVFIHM